MKGIDNILKPLYDLWHKVMDKMSVVKDRVVIDGHEVVVKFIVENIKALTDDQCEALQCGDVVAKKTGNMFHLYQVTYKENKHGICLTYQAAGLQETQSYDYTNGHWVYNSEDVVETGGHTDAQVKALAIDAVEDANSGTIVDSLGLDTDGNLVKGQAGGGTKLYLHTIGNAKIISTRQEKYTSWSQVYADNIIAFRYNGTTFQYPLSALLTDGTYFSYAIYDASNAKWNIGQLPSFSADVVTEL